MNPQISMDEPTHDAIIISGVINKEWFPYYGNMILEMKDRGDKRPITTLTGPVPDQAALISMLNLLYDMRCPLLSVECLAKE